MTKYTYEPEGQAPEGAESVMRMRHEDTHPSLTRPINEVAWGRDESDPCQRGTVGCCIDHHGERDDTCDTW